MTQELSDPEVRDRRRRGQELLAGSAGEASGDGLRLAVLSSFSVDLLPAFLAEALTRGGVPVTAVVLGNFGQISQEALDPGSAALNTEPHAVVVLPAAEDLLAALYRGAPLITDEFAAELVDDRIAELTAAIEALLARLPSATIYVAAVGAEHVPLSSVLDPGSPQRGQSAVDAFMQRVRRLGSISPRVVVVDWDWHSRGHGVRGYVDERLWYLARMRLNPLGLASFSELLAAHVRAQQGITQKAIVVDLDNTLWQGIVGEDGLAGIEVGDEGIGLAFADFQRELLALRETGIVLTICSKNNPADAHEALERHPGMILRREHFAAERINWEDKATNIASLADELDLGVDSFVFLDDNPAEREYVRLALPSVAVPELPADPALRPRALRELTLLNRVSLTVADAGRARSYAAQAERKRARSASLTLEDYVASLEQEVTIIPVDDASLARAAQMSQRTNQFNLTSRRYSVAELEPMLEDDAIDLHTVSVRDRFGDSGIVGLAIVRFGDSADAEIDTFLLSCRVLGRGVENVLADSIVRRSAARGVRVLYGSYIASAKNAQVADLYPRLGFSAEGDGRFSLDLSSAQTDDKEAAAEHA